MVSQFVPAMEGILDEQCRVLSGCFLNKKARDAANYREELDDAFIPDWIL
jgi:hypothetical protein